MSQKSELKALYAEVPKLKCKGLCQASCGPIAMTRLENSVIKKRIGRNFPAPSRFDHSCAMLTQVGRCSIYGDRPLICRLWGVVESMRCPHGCIPEGGFWSDEKAKDLFVRVLAISGESEDSVAQDAIRALGQAATVAVEREREKK